MDKMMGLLPVKKIFEVLSQEESKDIVVLDVKGVCSFANIFIFATTISIIQNQTIQEKINQQLRKLSVIPVRIEGRMDEWLLMDYDSVVIHLLTAKARKGYDLERLWEQGKKISLQEFTDSLVEHDDSFPFAMTWGI